MKTLLIIYPGTNVRQDCVFNLLVAETGEHLASHLCSHSAFAKGDLYLNCPQRIKDFTERFGEIEVKYKLTDLKFTPGPWTVVNLHSLNFAIRVPEGLICTVIKPSKFPGQDERFMQEIKTMQDNAILISKSPDLLAALVEARDVMQAFDMKSDKVNETLDKINKVLSSHVT